MEHSELAEMFEEGVLSKMSRPDLERLFLDEETLAWLAWSQFYRVDEEGHFADGSPEKFFSTMRSKMCSD